MLVLKVLSASTQLNRRAELLFELWVQGTAEVAAEYLLLRDPHSDHLLLDNCAVVLVLIAALERGIKAVSGRLFFFIHLVSL